MSARLSKVSTGLVSKQKNESQVSQGLFSAFSVGGACAFVQTAPSPSPWEFPKETSALGSLRVISSANTDLITIWP